MVSEAKRDVRSRGPTAPNAPAQRPLARARHLSPSDVARVRAQDYREAFNLFDKDKDGFISVDELQTVMRSVGHNPTNAEVRELINQVGARRAPQ